MVLRTIKPSESSSFLLLGPRGTGKSTLLRERFAGRRTIWVDLLDPETEHRYSMQPAALRELVAAAPAAEWVVIDEIQKVPALLDVVHGCIESPLGKDRGVRFAMTGSSARRLKRGAVNLLAGRAFVYHLFPLTARELGPAFDLLQCLRFGTLPATLAFAAVKIGDGSRFGLMTTRSSGRRPSKSAPVPDCPSRIVSATGAGLAT